MRLNRAVITDHALLNKNDATLGWFVRNEWYRNTYFSVARLHTPDALPSIGCSAASGNCLRFNDNSTYNIRVGRSPDVLGLYLDRDGTPMLEGGGSLVLGAAGAWVGPGHNAILIEGTRAYNVYHAYAAANGAAQLRISELVWDADGWPISGGP